MILDNGLSLPAMFPCPCTVRHGLGLDGVQQQTALQFVCYLSSVFSPDSSSGSYIVDVGTSKVHCISCHFRLECVVVVVVAAAVCCASSRWAATLCSDSLAHVLSCSSWACCDGKVSTAELRSKGGKYKTKKKTCWAEMSLPVRAITCLYTSSSHTPEEMSGRVSSAL